MTVTTFKEYAEAVLSRTERRRRNQVEYVIPGRAGESLALALGYYSFTWDFGAASSVTGGDGHTIYSVQLRLYVDVQAPASADPAVSDEGDLCLVTFYRGESAETFENPLVRFDQMLPKPVLPNRHDLMVEIS